MVSDRSLESLNHFFFLTIPETRTTFNEFDCGANENNYQHNHKKYDHTDFGNFLPPLFIPCLLNSPLSTCSDRLGVTRSTCSGMDGKC